MISSIGDELQLLLRINVLCSNMCVCDSFALTGVKEPRTECCHEKSVYCSSLCMSLQVNVFADICLLLC